jgi:glycosyltransferase involved in cell wall biosynthesis
MEKYQVVIIIPAFNEENTIANVVQSVKKYGDVIVVNDASIDSTEKRARGSGAIVINHNQNKGYDQALNSGFIEAERRNYDAVITFDADGQHRPFYIKKVIEMLDDGADIVITNRDIHQRVAESFFSFITKKIYGIYDPLSGLKGYRISIYKSLGHFDSYGSIGTELMLFAVKNGYSMKQFPIKLKERIDAPRFGKALNANYKIFRAMLNSFI